MRTSTAIASIVCGCVALTAQTEPARGSDEVLDRAWRQALADAKRQHAPVLAFVLPPADVPVAAARAAAIRAAERERGLLSIRIPRANEIETTREAVLRLVQLLRAGRSPEDRSRGHEFAPMLPTPSELVFALSIPVVVRAGSVGAKDGETVVLLGADGERRKGFAVDLLDHGAFLSTVGALLLDDDELAAAKIAASETAERIARLRRIDAGEQPVAWTEARRELLARLRDVTALSIRREDDGYTADSIVWELEYQRPPLGTESIEFQGDPCPPCGMAFVPPGMNTVLKLIGP